MRVSRLLGLIAATACLTCSSAALAQGGPPAPAGAGAPEIGVGAEPPPAPAAAPAAPPKKRGYHMEREWYGWQPLAADGGAAASFVLGLATQTKALTAFGIGGYLLIPPVIHFTHGNVGEGFGDFAIRLFTPLLGSGIGALVGIFVGISFISSGSTTSGPFDATSSLGKGVAYGTIIGAGLGWATAVGIDAGLLSYEKLRVDDAASRPPTRPWFSVAPTFDVARDHGSLGVGGTF